MKKSIQLTYFKNCKLRTVYTSYVKLNKVWIIVARHRIGNAMPYIPTKSCGLGDENSKNVDGIEMIRNNRIDMREPMIIKSIIPKTFIVQYFSILYYR